MSDNRGYRLSFGPWNIHEGADPFGPPVRPTVEYSKKLASFKKLGYDAIMLHDDDVVLDIENKSATQVIKEAQAYKKMLDDQGLLPEIVAPRLWENDKGIDGAYTANDASIRKWAIERSKQCADIADVLGTDLMVLWLAREGTYIREAKSAITSHRYLIDAMDAVLKHNKKIRIAIEPKPNEPMDHAYVPTIGHAIALGHQTIDPSRVGGVIESAHAILAGLDASDEMAFGLQAGKLWTIHLNDQNGLKYDQDKSFGAANLRGAFNQVRVMEEAGYARTGMIAFDVKAMRTQPADRALAHLDNSRKLFLHLVDKVRSFDTNLEKDLRAARDYEALEMAVLEHLMGV